MEHEVSFQCPYCGEGISMVVDLSVSDQEYIEDCEVCCRPIKLSYEVADETVVSLAATRLDD